MDESSTPMTAEEEEEESKTESRPAELKPMSLPGVVVAQKTVAAAAKKHRGGGGRSTAKTTTTRTLVVLNVATALSGFLFGYDTGVVSGVVEEIQDTLKLSTSQIGWAVGITPIMSAVFALLSASMNVVYGRKPTLILAAVLYTLGAVVVAGARGYESMLLGRAFLGVAVGCGSMTTPIFIGEIAPKFRRGRMVTLYDMMIVVGQLFASAFNGGAQYLGRGSWRLSTGLAVLPAMAQLLMLLTLPESPRWLVAKGKRAQARTVLSKLRAPEFAVTFEEKDSSFQEDKEEDTRNATNREIELELDSIQAIVDAERRAKDDSGSGVGSAFLGMSRNVEPWVATVRTLARRRALSVGVAIMTFQAFTGINAVMYYGATIAREVGFSQETSVWIAAVFDFAQLLGVICSITRMDLYGRRYLAMQSTTGTILALGLMVLFAALGPHVCVVVSTLVYLFVFGSGLSGVAWTLNSEVHPLATRSHAQAIAVASNWGANAVVSVFFLTLEASYGSAVAFLPFLVTTILALAWMNFFLPETKGVSLERLEQRFEFPLYPAAKVPPALEQNDFAAAASAPSSSAPKPNTTIDEPEENIELV